MQTTVQIKTPAFEGSFTCTIEWQEWSAFVKTLHGLRSAIGEEAEASWGNMEDNIEFQFKLHKLGTLEGQYKFSPENLSLGPVLSGTFEADQTYLEDWVQSAQQVLNGAR